MPLVDDHKAEAFVHRLRVEAAEGVKHFVNLPHYAGSTKTALALTLLAYTAGKRDGLKPRATELAAINKYLSWTKYELAKRDLEQEEIIKRLQIDLRWARFQLGKKEDKDKELAALKAELDARRKIQERRKENEALPASSFNGTAKIAELQDHTVATDDNDMRSLKEQPKHERLEKERCKELSESLSCTSIPDDQSSSEYFQAKVGALQETIDLIEEHFKETCSQLQTQLAQAEQQVHEMKLKHAIEVKEVEEKFAVEIDALHYELSVKEEKLEEQANAHRVQPVQATTRRQEEIHHVTRENASLKAQANAFRVQIENVQKHSTVCQAETHRVTWEKEKMLEEKNKEIAGLKKSLQSQGGCPPNNQRFMEDRIKFLIEEKELQHQEWQQKLRRAQNENNAFTNPANYSQVTDTPSIHIKSIQKLEEKLTVIESKANKNEQNLNKKVQELENKLAQLGPLERFLEDCDFSDEKRLHLTWDDMTYAVRAAAAGLSPQIRRTLGHGHSTYIVEEALRHGSRDLVSFALDSPGRFVLRFKFFEAVESIVDNILWEAQKFPSVRKMLKEDSTNVKMALVRHASK